MGWEGRGGGKKSRTMGGSLAIVIRDSSATNEDNGIKAFGSYQNGDPLKKASIVKINKEMTN